MSTIAVISLAIALFVLLLVSAFFSSSETAMMALNRYKLRHQMKQGVRSAKRVFYLLDRPDRLLGIILTGNTFANIVASSLATLVCTHLFKEWGALIASVGLTVIILIFAEIAPKTLAAYYALTWAKLTSLPLYLMLVVLSPIVIALTAIANGVLFVFGFRGKRGNNTDSLSADELRSVVNEAKNHIPGKYLNMLLGILDLQQLSINDIMVPRDEIVAIDLQNDWQQILDTIKRSQYTRIPVCHNSLDEVVGILHLRDVSHLLLDGKLTMNLMKALLREPYFVPEATSLYQQLMNFQKRKRRSALVVDEYGAVIGLATLEDILEEVVGDFTTDVSAPSKIAYKQNDGSYLLKGNINLRIANEIMGWGLPENGPKTLGGLMIDVLQTIPSAPVCIEIENYRLTVEQIRKNKIKLVRVKVK